MRDKNRIKIICDALYDAWMTCPDQRLGQLLENYVFPGSYDKEKHMRYPIIFWQEDNITLSKLQDLASEKNDKYNLSVK